MRIQNGKLIGILTEAAMGVVKNKFKYADTVEKAKAIYLLVRKELGPELTKAEKLEFGVEVPKPKVPVVPTVPTTPTVPTAKADKEAGPVEYAKQEELAKEAADAALEDVLEEEKPKKKAKR